MNANPVRNIHIFKKQCELKKYAHESPNWATKIYFIFIHLIRIIRRFVLAIRIFALSIMDPISNLTELFKHFPGIGPRQAKRFVYFLLHQNEMEIDRLTSGIRALSEVKQCADCRLYFPAKQNQTLCRICANPAREVGKLMIVERDTDLATVEKAGVYSGRYFVLSGNIPILDKNPDEKINLPALCDLIVKNSKSLEEIIIALSASTEGDYTAEYLKINLRKLSEKFGFKISILGRGLSTGSELEYADPDTIRNALDNRK